MTKAEIDRWREWWKKYLINMAVIFVLIRPVGNFLHLYFFLFLFFSISYYHFLSLYPYHCGIILFQYSSIVIFIINFALILTVSNIITNYDYHYHYVAALIIDIITIVINYFILFSFLTFFYFHLSPSYIIIIFLRLLFLSITNALNYLISMKIWSYKAILFFFLNGG